MQVEIENFRIHDKFTILLDQEAKIIRIDGQSGIGKSTILEAIAWCLYGKIKDFNDIRTEHKKVVKVCLTFPTLQIYRQANPGLFSVQNLTDKYLGDIAQAHINNLYGVWEMWLNIAYIKQKNRCKFLESSNKEKLHLLNLIAFKGLDIKEYIEKIQAMIKLKKEVLENLKTSYNTELSIYQNNSKYKAEYLPEHLPLIEKQIAEAEKNLEGLIEKNKINEESRGRQNLLKERKNGLEKEVAAIMITSNDIINLENFNLEETNVLIESLRKKEILAEKFAKLKTQIKESLPALPLNQEDYDRAKNIEIQHMQYYQPLEKKIQNVYADLIGKNLPEVTLEMLNDLKNQEEKYKKKLELLKKLEGFKEYNLNENMTDKNYLESLEIEKNHQNLYLPLQKRKMEMEEKFKRENIEILEFPINSQLIEENKIHEKEYQEYLLLKNSLKDFAYLPEKYKNLNLNSNFSESAQQQSHAVIFSESSQQQSHFVTFSESAQQILIGDWYKYENDQKILAQLAQILQEVGSFRYAGDISDELLLKIYQEEELYKKEAPLISKHQLSPENQNLKIKLLEEEILYQENYLEILEYQTLQKKSLKSVDDLSDLLADLKLSRQAIPCPHCAKYVIWQGQKLERAEFKREIQEIKANLEEVSKELNEAKRLTYLSEKLSNLKIDFFQTLERKSIINLKNELTEIKSVKFIQLPETPYKSMKLIQQYRQLRPQAQQLEKPALTIQEGQMLLKFTQLEKMQKQEPIYKSSLLEENKKYQELSEKLKEAEKYQHLPLRSSQEIFKILEGQKLEKELNLYQVDQPLYAYQELNRYYQYSLDQKRLAELNEFKTLPSISSEMIQQILKNNQYLKEREELFSLGWKKEDEEQNFSEKILNLQMEIKKWQTWKDSRQKEIFLKEELKKIEEELNNILLDPHIAPTLLTYQNWLLQAKQTRDEIIYALKMREWEKKLVLQFEQINELALDIGAMFQLYQDGIAVECEQLQKTVDIINRRLNIIYQRIFSDNIRVQIRLFKTVKSTGKEKTEVNFLINYKGAEFNKISSLSGGEDDRISFGLIVVLASMYNSPVLLLDECLNSLNDDFREDCLEVLREFINDKKIFVISHQDIEGWFDHTIQIN